MKFIAKSFITKDSTGCEFKVEARYGDSSYDFAKHAFVRDCDYYAMGYHAKSLDELKKIIGSL